MQFVRHLSTKQARIYSSNGLRYVEPYYRLQSRAVHPRSRWVNKTILEVFHTEANDPNNNRFKRAIDDGRIRIFRSDEILEGPDNILKEKLLSGDVVEYNEHVHENPVKSWDSDNNDIKILYENEDIVVVDKPSGIPVHPVQKYYYNSVLMALNRPYELFPIHRLDKATSGVLMFGKNSEIVRKFKDMKNDSNWEIKKVYFAKVVGEFPKKIECLDDLVYVYPTRKFIKQFGPAKTIFKSAFYNDSKNESVVSCELFTGFPHQIRIHLRNLGYPIVNDPLYGLRGKYREVYKETIDITSGYERLIGQRGEKIRNLKMHVGECCNTCGVQLYKDPTQDELMIYLHAWKYSMNNETTEQKYIFETEVPNWAINKTGNRSS